MNDNIPDKCLAKIFNEEEGGFNTFFSPLKLAFEGFDEEISKLIAEIFFAKFLYWKYIGSEEAFLSEFYSLLKEVVIEATKKQTLWKKVFENAGLIIKLEETHTEEKDLVLSRDIVSTVKATTAREVSELGSFGRVLNNFNKVSFLFHEYYSRFYPLFSRHIAIADLR